jgi:Second Messenger Oligonucleotide or Dinucleotide Synthetase domain/Adenylyl/Guanylyl and SMODS C-terminal sensor domain
VKLIEYFDAFMADTVNLNQSRLDDLDCRVEAIVACLEADEIFGQRIRKHIPQGSWAQRTIIKPLQGDEFDADVLLLLKEDLEWNKTPRIYVEETHRALKRSSIYSSKLTLKSRCVRITYANDCHIDVVPHIHLSGLVTDREVIVNRVANEFEDVNPDAFTKWMRERDVTTHGGLRKVIRILKYIRDFKNTFSVPSVILTTVLGHRVRQGLLADPYPDLPTSLRRLLCDLDDWLQGMPTRPRIDDPGCPQTNFDHRWDEEQYRNFRNKIHMYARKVAAAYDEPDKETSIALWQEVLGERFRAPMAKVASQPVMKASDHRTRQRDVGEMFIDEMGYTTVGSHIVRIECRVTRRSDGVDEGLLRGMGKVRKHRDLLFSVVNCNVPRPYQVLWKIKNGGAEAASLQALRGEIVPDDGRRLRHEQTLYTGVHYVECYIVKDAMVLATANHPVVVW